MSKAAAIVGDPPYHASTVPAIATIAIAHQRYFGQFAI
jgi:hypothetical protein